VESFTLGLGFPNVVLIGHSYGGVKVVYYQANRRDPHVLGLVLASPGPVNLTRFREPDLLEEARRLVAEGRGGQLLPPQSSGEPRHSAQTYLGCAAPSIDVFGAETSAPAIAQVSCPVLALYGGREDQPLAAAAFERIKRQAAGRVETRIIEGAVHSYLGSEAAAATVIANWMDAVLASPEATSRDSASRQDVRHG
jgi:pimeloyl-ACP methyl ester carboxylesterase